MTELGYKNLTTLLTTLGLTACVLAACGSSAGVKGSGNSAMLLEETSAFSDNLSLTSDDQIMTLGRLAVDKVAASTKQGVGYNIDLSTGNIETIPRYFSFDDSKSTVFTVSSNFVWVIDHAETMVGRNPTPPGAGGAIQISKVSVSDMVSDTTNLQPVAANEYQLFLLNGNSIVVFTWTNNGIKRQEMPLPSALAKDEYTLGAGSIDAVSKDYGFWIATNQRLLFYTNSWFSQPIGLPSGNGAPGLISMTYQNQSPSQNGETIGLFNSDVLATLGTSTGKQKSGGST